MNERRDKRFGLFTACFGEGEESRAVVFPGDYYSEEGSRWKIGGPRRKETALDRPKHSRPNTVPRPWKQPRTCNS